MPGEHSVRISDGLIRVATLAAALLTAGWQAHAWLSDDRDLTEIRSELRLVRVELCEMRRALEVRGTTAICSEYGSERVRGLQAQERP